MGLEQSSLKDGTTISINKKKKQIAHQDSLSSGNISPLSAELPYYNYFTGKSIGTDVSTLLTNAIQQPLPTSKSLNFNQMRGNKNLSNLQSNSLPEGITVVSHGRTKTVETDPFIQQLNAIPLFYPILKSGLYIPNKELDNSLNRDATTVNEISSRINHISDSVKSHLNGLSEDLVTKQYNEINPKMVSIENSLNTLTRDLLDKSTRLDALLDTFTDQDFDSTTSGSVLGKLQIDMERLRQLCNELEEKLPSGCIIQTDT